MATSSVAYNKPVLPRVSDTSDLASNRASVYSGKALDFDGVNDGIVLPNMTAINSGDVSVSLYAKFGQVGSADNVMFSQGTQALNSAFIFLINSLGVIRFAFYGNDLDAASSFNPKVDTWYHFVVTYNRTTNARKIYKNGVLIASDTSASDPTASGSFHISRNAWGTYSDNTIAGLKLFSSELTAAQVAELYNNPEQILPTGVAAVNLKLWLPMMEGAGSYVYNGAAGSLGEELVSNGTVDEVCQKWAFTDNGYLTATGGKLVWNVPNGSGSTAVQYLDIQANKTYRVTFDYSLNRDGFSVVLGNANNASAPVVTGTGTYTIDLTPTSTNGGLFSLNMSAGTGDLTGYMDNISVKEVVPQATGTISGATWVAGVGEPVPQTALIDWNKTTNNVVYSNAFTSTGWLSNFSSGNKVFGFRNPFGAPTAWKISIPSGATYYVYRTLSGFSAGSVTMSGWFRADQQVVIGFNDGNNYPNNITVGNEWERKSFTFTYGGAGIGIQMDNYFGVSPASAAKEFYVYGLQATQGATVQPYIETEATAQTSPVLLPEGLTSSKDIFGSDIAKPSSAGAFNFDGVDSSARITKNASLSVSVFTVEGWFYPKKSGYVSVLQTGNGSGGFHYYVGVSSLPQRLYVNGASTDSASYLTINSWNHCVAVHDGVRTKFYLNGVLDADTSNATGGANAMPINQAWIGTNDTGTEDNEYQFANVRLYNYALTAEQVADNFNQKASTFGKNKVVGELQAYINRTVAAGATVEAHSALLNTLTELENK